MRALFDEDKRVCSTTYSIPVLLVCLASVHWPVATSSFSASLAHANSHCNWLYPYSSYSSFFSSFGTSFLFPLAPFLNFLVSFPAHILHLSCDKIPLCHFLTQLRPGISGSVQVHIFTRSPFSVCSGSLLRFLVASYFSSSIFVTPSLHSRRRVPPS
jgi:hypothetical protein